MHYLRQNTAVLVTIGPILDDTDGLTPLDAATVTGITGVMAYDDDDGTAGGHFDFTCSASAGDNDLVAVGHNGLWTLELTQAQTNFTGRAILSLTDPDQICPTFHEFTVLRANVYDSLFTGAGQTADTLDVNTSTNADKTGYALATADWTTTSDLTTLAADASAAATAAVIARKILQNNKYVTFGAGATTLTVCADDGTTPWLTAPLTNNAGTKFLITDYGPANMGPLA